MRRNLSIRVKLPLIIVSTCVLALLLAGGAFVVNQRRDAKLYLIQESTVLAEVIANRSTAALVFEDRRLASENLATYALHDPIDKACIFIDKEQVFATYSRDGSQDPWPSPPEEGYSYHFDKDYLHMFQPIELENKLLGYVYVRYQLRQYKAEQRQQLFAAMVILAVAALFAYLISYRLLKGISSPIGDLAGMAKSVADNNDYSVRAKSSESQDEIGSLINAFNTMLAQIESRNSALQQSEERLQLALDGAELGTWDWDLTTNKVYFSPRYFSMLGYEENEFPHTLTTWENLLHPDDKEVVKNEIIDCLTKKDANWSVKFRLCQKDGTYRWILGCGKVVEYDQNSNPIRAAGTHLDINLQKLAEEELSRLRSLLNNIIDSMPSTLVSVDNNGIVTQWNLAATKATGIAAKQAIGQSLTEVYPRLVDEMDRVRQAIADRKILDGKRITTHVDDGLSLEDVTIYPLIANGIDGAVIRIDDVTNKVRLEEMMIQTEKMMSVGGLAAGMAHEINNPLGVMMHASQNIQRRFSASLPDNIKAAEKFGLNMADLVSYVEERRILETISEIRVAGERAASIVANMLQFSRKSESLHQSFDLSELIDKTLELASNDYDLKKKFDFRQIEIVREYHPDATKVPVITTEFEQVILNLLKNGAQAMAEKEKQEKSRFIIRVLPDNGMVRVEVEDNGPGMSEAISKRIFEPFFTTKPVGLGTGLGLAVSFMIIVNNHKGTMEVESVPGQGAKFIIRLPINIGRVTT